MMTQNFEQTRKAMEKYADLFGTGMKASPWLDADLNKKIKDYMERNVAAANEFMRKLSEAKDVQSFWLIQTNFMQTPDESSSPSDNRPAAKEIENPDCD